MDFKTRLTDGLMVFDGAMGTQIQALNPTDQEWNGCMGCSEVLNLTAPNKVQEIHERYLEAGSDAVETNTFSGSRIVLAEYGLADRVIEINRIAAEIARRAVARHAVEKSRYVIGSMGPGTKLISLGQTDFQTMYRSYVDQAAGLLQGGVDAFLIETCQDLLQIKTCLLAVYDAMEQSRATCPVMVTVTVETSGTLLMGSDISAVLATLSPFAIDGIGLNCATGPDLMAPYLKQICATFPGPVICQPNAGLPENVNGSLVYTCSVDDFADTLMGYVADFGVRIIGGCCGTDPRFIRALCQRARTTQPGVRHPEGHPSLASAFSAKSLDQQPKPFFVGERANTNGSRKFQKFLLAEDWDGIVELAGNQQQSGAHGMDLCVAYTGRDEGVDMQRAVSRLVNQVDLPLFIDSTDPGVIETALQLIPGRPVINSVNLEDGEERAREICRLAKRYGAALIALTIDEAGMALEAPKKLAVAQRIFEIAVHQIGLSPPDLIFDPLTFTLGSGDASLLDAGRQTLEGIRAIKQQLPGVWTILGVSNVSFGLNAFSRQALNSVFLAEAVAAGLDLAIVHVSKIKPLTELDADDLEQCRNLIFNRTGTALLDFIRHFDGKAGQRQEIENRREEERTVEERIAQRVIRGNRSGLKDLLLTQLDTTPALQIINETLIPAMKSVGDLFGAGKLQLPFVLQSAEVMKFAVSILEPHMAKTHETSQTSLVIATVRGDVHDIGKNLVDIILSNNGYKVYNLGIKCEIDAMIKKVQEVGADALGMSGLLVKSTAVMKENLEELHRRGLDIPVLLGGAALKRGYVEEVCAPIHDGPVFYCADAFAGMAVMQAIRSGNPSESAALSPPRKNHTRKPPATRPKRNDAPAIRRDVTIPTPPFWGRKIVSDLDLETIFAYLTEPVLFRGRWGYRRGNLSREEYDLLVDQTVRPEFEALKQRCRRDKLLVPRVVYGYYPCYRQGEELVVLDRPGGAEELRFRFPRQKKPPYRCIADFFLSPDEGDHDVLAVQVVTVGSRAAEEAQRLFRADAYKDYLLFHGLSIETAEALAEYWHRRVREELDLTQEDGSSMAEWVVQEYRGSRYSFGYPACPDLAENRKIFHLLLPEDIGVHLTEGDQMEPEQTTSAIIVHHPQAKYFTLE